LLPQRQALWLLRALLLRRWQALALLQQGLLLLLLL
jgi:hypothetical protein